MIDELFGKFDGAFAPNTIRAYRSDYHHFASWCKSMNIDPLDCSSTALSDYIEGISTKLASATIRRRVDSLSSIFKLLGLSNPCSKPEVVLTLKRIYRQKGRNQSQATPLTKEVLNQLLKVCDEDIRGLRDKIMLKLGYETMRRRSELCQFKFSDVKHLPNNKKALMLQFSKTDQFGYGRLIPISNDLHSLLNKWHSLVNDNSYILRGINKGNIITPKLHPVSINRRVKELQHKANLKLEGELSGHSFRVGAAIDLLMEGETLEKIMLKGGWKSESSAMKYLRMWQY